MSKKKGWFTRLVNRIFNIPDVSNLVEQHDRATDDFFVDGVSAARVKSEKKQTSMASRPAPGRPSPSNRPTTTSRHDPIVNDSVRDIVAYSSYSDSSSSRSSSSCSSSSSSSSDSSSSSCGSD